MPRLTPVLVLVCVAALGIGAAAASPNDDPVALKPPAPKPTSVTTTCPIPARYRAAFAAAADDARLPLALLAAVAHEESRFTAGARSSRGAVGLLQVMPVTGRALGLDVSTPEANVLAGARFLRQLLDRFGSADVALAAYNAGPAAVEQARGAPSGAVVRYVANVNARWRAHAGCTV
jgi:soluble lytic murein transglycosylase-like protein